KADRYRVDQDRWMPPSLAIDLGRLGGENAGLARLRDPGVEFPGVVNQCRLRFPDDWWSDSIDLVAPDAGRLRRLAARYDNQPILVRCWAAPERATLPLEPLSPWLVLAPHTAPTGSPHQRDAASEDKVVLGVWSHVKALSGLQAC